MKRRQAILEAKIAELAAKHGLTRRQVTEVEDSVWKFVKQEIENTSTETEEVSNIYVRFLGTIYCPPGKIKRVKEKINGKT